MPPNNYIWNYTADQPGQEVLRFANGKPWMPTPANVVTVSIEITAKEVEELPPQPATDCNSYDTIATCTAHPTCAWSHWGCVSKVASFSPHIY